VRLLDLLKVDGFLVQTYLSVILSYLVAFFVLLHELLQV
jgi:hypothetical protein